MEIHSLNAEGSILKVIKAALINIFTLRKDQMIMCNVKGVVSRDKLIENFHPTLHFPSALQSFASFS